MVEAMYGSDDPFVKSAPVVGIGEHKDCFALSGFGNHDILTPAVVSPLPGEDPRVPLLDAPAEAPREHRSDRNLWLRNRRVADGSCQKLRVVVG